MRRMYRNTRASLSRRMPRCGMLSGEGIRSLRRMSGYSVQAPGAVFLRPGAWGHPFGRKDRAVQEMVHGIRGRSRSSAVNEPNGRVLRGG